MLELWQTIFAGLSFVVFAVTAVIAVVQIRHLRRSYQMGTASALLEAYWTPQFQSWLRFVFFDLEAQLQSAPYRQELGGVPVDKTRHPEVYVCEYYTLIGSYIKMGLIPKRIFLENGSSDAVNVWRRVKSAVEIMRGADITTLYRDFEELAALCEQYRAAER